MLYIISCNVSGVLDDFRGTSEELYDSVGGILLEMDSCATEEGVEAICRKIHHSLGLEYVTFNLLGNY